MIVVHLRSRGVGRSQVHPNASPVDAAGASTAGWSSAKLRNAYANIFPRSPWEFKRHLSDKQAELERSIGATIVTILGLAEAKTAQTENDGVWKSSQGWSHTVARTPVRPSNKFMQPWSVSSQDVALHKRGSATMDCRFRCQLCFLSYDSYCILDTSRYSNSWIGDLDLVLRYISEMSLTSTSRNAGA